jgi:hypothetical protein
LKRHGGCRIERSVDAPPWLAVEQSPIVPGASIVLCEQNVARTKPKSAVARREFERAAERDDELPRGVRMPSEF